MNSGCKMERNRISNISFLDDDFFNSLSASKEEEENEEPKKDWWNPLSFVSKEPTEPKDIREVSFLDDDFFKPQPEPEIGNDPEVELMLQERARQKEKERLDALLQGEVDLKNYAEGQVPESPRFVPDEMLPSPQLPPEQVMGPSLPPEVPQMGGVDRREFEDNLYREQAPQRAEDLELEKQRIIKEQGLPSWAILDDVQVPTRDEKIQRIIEDPVKRKEFGAATIPEDLQYIMSGENEKEVAKRKKLYKTKWNSIMAGMTGQIDHINKTLANWQDSAVAALHSATGRNDWKTEYDIQRKKRDKTGGFNIFKPVKAVLNAPVALGKSLISGESFDKEFEILNKTGLIDKLEEIIDPEFAARYYDERADDSFVGKALRVGGQLIVDLPLLKGGAFLKSLNLPIQGAIMSLGDKELDSVREIGELAGKGALHGAVLDKTIHIANKLIPALSFGKSKLLGKAKGGKNIDSEVESIKNLLA